MKTYCFLYDIPGCLTVDAETEEEAWSIFESECEDSSNAYNIECKIVVDIDEE